MKLIKIDPVNRRISSEESDGSHQWFYQQINCRLLDVCARQPSRDALVVDDESLEADPQPPAFLFDGFGPVHGIAIVTGCEREGALTEPAFTLAEVTERVSWLGAIYINPDIRVTSW